MGRRRRTRVRACAEYTSFDERDGSWGVHNCLVAADGDALLEQGEELARARAEIGYLVEEAVEVRGVDVTSDRVQVDVGKDDFLFLVRRVGVVVHDGSNLRVLGTLVQ